MAEETSNSNSSSIQDIESINRFQVLGFEQVYRLHEVMEGSLPVHGRGNFPTLNIKLKELVQVVRNQLVNDGIKLNDIRLNGGAASYILGSEADKVYNDLDLIFGVDLSANSNDLQKCKSAVLDSLLDFLPEGVSKEKMSGCSLKDAYVQKMVKVCNDTDKWSLISLSNNKGRNVELKFVHHMKRQFEFSVDSFQIILDSLLTFYDISQTPMSEHFYPTVVAESVYGNFNQALYHLNKKLIATRNPEQIRGGGLLKYCNLLVRGYTVADDIDVKSLQRYMCSRFFIDFSDINLQSIKLENYLLNHFIGEEQNKYDYLMILYNVVDNSTVCLMNGERRQTLSLIQQMAAYVLLEQEQKAYNKQLIMKQFDQQSFPTTFDQQNNLIIDQVYYGPCMSYPLVTADQYYTTYTYIPSASTTTTTVSSPYPTNMTNNQLQSLPGQCPYCPPPPPYVQCS